MILALICTAILEVLIKDILDDVDVYKTELVKYSTVVGAKIQNKTTLHIKNDLLK